MVVFFSLEVNGIELRDIWVNAKGCSGYKTTISPEVRKKVFLFL